MWPTDVTALRTPHPPPAGHLPPSSPRRVDDRCRDSPRRCRPRGATEGVQDGGHRHCGSRWRVDHEGIPQAGTAGLAGTRQSRLSDDSPEATPAHCRRGHRGGGCNINCVTGYYDGSIQ